MTDRLLSYLADGEKHYVQIWQHMQVGDTFDPYLEQLVTSGEVIERKTDDGSYYKLKGTK